MENNDNIAEQPVQGSAGKKFRDGDSLARAYDALEAEFTRKSQLLAETLKKMEQLKAADEEKRAAQEAKDAFLARYPRAAELIEDITSTAEDASQDSYREAYIRLMSERYVLPEALQNDEQFLLKAADSQTVKDAVLKDYLARMSGGNSAAVRGGFAPVSPRYSAKTLSEAGKLAESLFDRGTD